MSTWRDAASAAIYRVHASLPAGVQLAERVAAIDAAYPFGVRAYFPYKAWLSERKKYLCKFGHQPRGMKQHESPLERAMRRSGK